MSKFFIFCFITALASMSSNADFFMKNSIAHSTSYKYEKNFSIFRSWCLSHKLPFLPSNMEVLKLFLSDFSCQKSSAKQLNIFIAAIKFYHDLNFFDNSFASAPSIRRLVEGASRVFGKPIKKMKPLGENIVKLLIDNFLLSDLQGRLFSPIDIWRTVFLSSFTYFCCCRFDCVNKLLIGDIVFHHDDSFMKVMFPRSKTDQKREGCCGSKFYLLPG